MEAILPKMLARLNPNYKEDKCAVLAVLHFSFCYHLDLKERPAMSNFNLNTLICAPLQLSRFI